MITSVQNNKVKQWNKLKKRKNREKKNLFLVEGFHLVEEAIHSNWHINEIIVQEGMEVPSWISDEPITYVSEAVFQSISETKTPQGIAAIVEMDQRTWRSDSFHQILLIDAVQDPGNLGTMIRTADAAGFDAIILGDGTVDLYNEKVIRATQGSIFHLPIYQFNLINNIDDLKADGFEVWASTLKDAKAYTSRTVPNKIALIVGNEGSGINEELVERSDQKVHIPIYGQAESLNVSIAAGILLYYIANQR